MIYIILGFALFLRLVSINQSFWLDEATTGIVARNLSLTEFFNEFLPGDFHPPLYYLAVKAWGNLFGFGEVILRLPSVIFGVATVYVTCLIGSKIKGKSMGALAALLMATAPLHVYYSQEARFYAATTLLVSLSVFFYLKKHWVGFATTLLAIGMTDYLPLFIIPVFWLYEVLKNKALSKKFVLAHVPLAIGFLAIGNIFLAQVAGGASVRASGSAWWEVLGKTNLKNLALVPVKFATGRINFGNNLVYAIFIFTALFTFSILVYRLKERLKRPKNGEFFILLWLVVPILIAAAAGFFVPVMRFFRFLFVLPAMYLLIAAGINALKPERFVPALALVLAINLFFTHRYLAGARFHREDWRGLVNFISQNSPVDSSQIVFVSNSQMEGYRYYDRDAKLLGGASGVDKSKETVWVMRYVQDIFDPEDSVRRSVEELGYEKLSEYDFNGIVVWKYENSN